jgi:hypothetical protein
MTFCKLALNFRVGATIERLVRGREGSGSVARDGRQGTLSLVLQEWQTSGRSLWNAGLPGIALAQTCLLCGRFCAWLSSIQSFVGWPTMV